MIAGEVLWETVVTSMPAEQRHRMDTSAAPTPVTDGAHVFVYFGSHLAALDLDGGIEGGGYHVSLVAGDGKVYVPNARGVVTVIEAASPKGRVISVNLLDRGGNASPAVAYGSLLFRTRDQLVRVDREDPAGS